MIGITWIRVSQSYETARNYKKAAKSGLVRAINCLGCMYQYGRGTQEDLKEAEYWFRQAADLGDADGMNNLAMLLEDKLGNSLDEYLNGNTEGTHTRHGGISQSNLTCYKLCVILRYISLTQQSKGIWMQ